MKLPVTIFFIQFFLVNIVAAGEKIEFWDTQRKGANFFNATPKEEWFQAANELGVEWVRMAYDKWDGQHRDFLMGDAGNFTGVIQKDLAKLIDVLDWADKYKIKVVITSLGVPGNRWAQNNGGRRDLRLWEDTAYWQQTASFWRELAAQLHNHPAVYGYNILNEPTPEMNTGLAEHGPVLRYKSWYQKHRGTSRDLPAFYETVIAAIREVDSKTPIMLDSGWYAQPNAFVYWPKIKKDDKVLYSFHMYEPYAFTNRKNFHDKHNLVYPGKISFANKVVEWNKQQIEIYFSSFFEWAKAQGIPPNRLVSGEFGC